MLHEVECDLAAEALAVQQVDNAAQFLPARFLVDIVWSGFFGGFFFV